MEMEASEAKQISSVWFRSCWVSPRTTTSTNEILAITFAPKLIADADSPTRQGVFGITRTTRAEGGRQACSDSIDSMECK